MTQYIAPTKATAPATPTPARAQTTSVPPTTTPIATTAPSRYTIKVEPKNTRITYGESFQTICTARNFPYEYAYDVTFQNMQTRETKIIPHATEIDYTRVPCDRTFSKTNNYTLSTSANGWLKEQINKNNTVLATYTLKVFRYNDITQSSEVPVTLSPESVTQFVITITPPIQPTAGTTITSATVPPTATPAPKATTTPIPPTPTPTTQTLDRTLIQLWNGFIQNFTGTQPTPTPTSCLKPAKPEWEENSTWVKDPADNGDLLTFNWKDVPGAKEYITTGYSNSTITNKLISTKTGSNTSYRIAPGRNSFTFNVVSSNDCGTSAPLEIVLQSPFKSITSTPTPVLPTATPAPQSNYELVQEYLQVIYPQVTNIQLPSNYESLINQQDKTSDNTQNIAFRITFCTAKTPIPAKLINVQLSNPFFMSLYYEKNNRKEILLMRESKQYPSARGGCVTENVSTDLTSLKEIYRTSFNDDIQLSFNYNHDMTFQTVALSSVQPRMVRAYVPATPAQTQGRSGTAPTATKAPTPTLRPTSTSFDCNKVTSIPIKECLALVDVYYSTHGPGWTIYKGRIPWLTTTDPCDWQGVYCGYNYINKRYGVVTLGLGSFSLRGVLSASIGNLSNLEVIDLPNNQLTGAIPESIGNLSNLFSLYLQNNQLTGAIPESIGNLSNLESLDFSNNRLTGAIPTSFSKLKKLTSFDMSNGNCLPTSLNEWYGKTYHRINNPASCGGVPLEPGLGQERRSTSTPLPTVTPGRGGTVLTPTVAPTATRTPTTSQSLTPEQKLEEYFKITKPYLKEIVVPADFNPNVTYPDDYYRNVSLKAIVCTQDNGPIPSNLTKVHEQKGGFGLTLINGPYQNWNFGSVTRIPPPRGQCASSTFNVLRGELKELYRLSFKSDVKVKLTGRFYEPTELSLSQVAPQLAHAYVPTTPTPNQDSRTLVGTPANLSLSTYRDENDRSNTKVKTIVLTRLNQKIPVYIHGLTSDDIKDIRLIAVTFKLDNNPQTYTWNLSNSSGDILKGFGRLDNTNILNPINEAVSHLIKGSTHDFTDILKSGVHTLGIVAEIEKTNTYGNRYKYATIEGSVYIDAVDAVKLLASPAVTSGQSGSAVQATTTSAPTLTPQPFKVIVKTTNKPIITYGDELDVTCDSVNSDYYYNFGGKIKDLTTNEEYIISRAYAANTDNVLKGYCSFRSSDYGTIYTDTPFKVEDMNTLINQGHKLKINYELSVWRFDESGNQVNITPTSDSVTTFTVIIQPKNRVIQTIQNFTTGVTNLIPSWLRSSTAKPTSTPEAKKTNVQEVADYLIRTGTKAELVFPAGYRYDPSANQDEPINVTLKICTAKGSSGTAPSLDEDTDVFYTLLDRPSLDIGFLIHEIPAADNTCVNKTQEIKRNKLTAKGNYKNLVLAFTVGGVDSNLLSITNRPTFVGIEEVTEYQRSFIGTLFPADVTTTGQDGGAAATATAPASTISLTTTENGQVRTNTIYLNNPTQKIPLYIRGLSNDEIKNINSILTKYSLDGTPILGGNINSNSSRDALRGYGRLENSNILHPLDISIETLITGNATIDRTAARDTLRSGSHTLVITSTIFVLDDERNEAKIYKKLTTSVKIDATKAMQLISTAQTLTPSVTIAPTDNISSGRGGESATITDTTSINNIAPSGTATAQARGSAQVASTATTSETPTPPVKKCVINSVKWDTTTATDGESVGITVSGSKECTGQTVQFKIVEYDGSSDDNDDVEISPANAGCFVPPSYSGTGEILCEAKTTWKAEHQSDGPFWNRSNPEYIVTASIAGTSTQKTSKELEVTEKGNNDSSPTPTLSPRDQAVIQNSQGRDGQGESVVATPKPTATVATTEANSTLPYIKIVPNNASYSYTYGDVLNTYCDLNEYAKFSYSYKTALLNTVTQDTYTPTNVAVTNSTSGKGSCTFSTDATRGYIPLGSTNTPDQKAIAWVEKNKKNQIKITYSITPYNTDGSEATNLDPRSSTHYSVEINPQQPDILVEQISNYIQQIKPFIKKISYPSNISTSTKPADLIPLNVEICKEINQPPSSPTELPKIQTSLVFYYPNEYDKMGTWVNNVTIPSPTDSCKKTDIVITYEDFLAVQSMFKSGKGYLVLQKSYSSTYHTAKNTPDIGFEAIVPTASICNVTSLSEESNSGGTVVLNVNKDPKATCSNNGSEYTAKQYNWGFWPDYSFPNSTKTYSSDSFPPTITFNDLKVGKTYWIEFKYNQNANQSTSRTAVPRFTFTTKTASETSIVPTTESTGSPVTGNNAQSAKLSDTYVVNIHGPVNGKTLDEQVNAELVEHSYADKNFPVTINADPGTYTLDLGTASKFNRDSGNLSAIGPIKITGAGRGKTNINLINANVNTGAITFEKVHLTVSGGGHFQLSNGTMNITDSTVTGKGALVWNNSTVNIRNTDMQFDIINANEFETLKKDINYQVLYAYNQSSLTLKNVIINTGNRPMTFENSTISISDSTLSNNEPLLKEARSKNFITVESSALTMNNTSIIHRIGGAPLNIFSGYTYKGVDIFGNNIDIKINTSSITFSCPAPVCDTFIPIYAGSASGQLTIDAETKLKRSFMNGAVYKEITINKDSENSMKITSPVYEVKID